MAAKTKSENGKEIERVTPKIGMAELAGIQSFADAVALAKQTFGEDNIAVASQVLGDGFKMLDNKDLLCGVAFFALTWDFSLGDYGEFVAIRVVTETNQKYVVTDGSAGICRQLSEYSASSGRYGGLFVENGLRKSEYMYTDDKGDEKPAVTYYLDLSA